MLGVVDAAQAISDLTEISPQVQRVVVIAADGSLVGSNSDPSGSQTLVDGARRLIGAAEELRPGVSQLEAATVSGSAFVVRDGDRLIAATTSPEPTVGLVFYDLKTCLRSIEEPKARAAAKKKVDDAAAEGRHGLPARGRLACRLGARAPARCAQAGTRRSLRFRRLDALVHRRIARSGPSPADRAGPARGVVTRDELAGALRDAAYLEGDFVLRSGRRSKYYLDKYRFETRPDLLAPLGRALAAAVREHEPEATRLAGPELGAVALATAASLESGLPFLIVRKEAKDYGTSKRLEGVFEPGERVCLIEDVVTTGGAALEAVQALRDAGLQVSSAICVVDREEGGIDAFARQAVRLRPLYRSSELRKDPANAHG
jgi:orotate phosphoribosyltransferase